MTLIIGDHCGEPFAAPLRYIGYTTVLSACKPVWEESYSLRNSATQTWCVIPLVLACSDYLWQQISSDTTFRDVFRQMACGLGISF